MRLNRGRFEIWSGDANFTVRNGEDRGFSQIPLIPGTGLFLSLDTHRPVNLGDTFLGDATWSYIDHIGEKVMDAGGLLVRDECVHTGSRQAAKSLRRKIQAILPDMDTVLVLDFEGVENASSSFLDELLGRLADELGPETFVSEIRIVNAPELVVDMANVVIHQRIGGIV